MEETTAQRKKENHSNKMIIGAVAFASLIPIVICVFLAIGFAGTKNANMEEETLLTEAQLEKDVAGVFATAQIHESPRGTKAEQLLQEETEKVAVYEREIYLTFDDGPSSNTDAILDTLKEYGVKATFFVVGKTDEKSKAAYRRIVAEGHTLGMHSYSHKYEEIYASKAGFVNDLTKLQEYLYEVTGVWPRHYRFPGGSSNQVSDIDMQELIAYLDANDITYYDWNVSAGDAAGGYHSKDGIVNDVVSGVKGRNVSIVLMHDASDKGTTVEALPEIISQVRMQGDAGFLPITDETVPIQHLKKQEAKEN